MSIKQILSNLLRIWLMTDTENKNIGGHLPRTLQQFMFLFYLFFFYRIPMACYMIASCVNKNVYIVFGFNSVN